MALIRQSALEQLLVGRQQLMNRVPSTTNARTI